MKKVLTLVLFITTILGYEDTTPPTLITLKIESSEILSDSEGTMPLSPKHPIKVFPKLKTKLVEDKAFVIRQVDENSFEILGSPLTRDIGEY